MFTLDDLLYLVYNTGFVVGALLGMVLGIAIGIAVKTVLP